MVNVAVIAPCQAAAHEAARNEVPGLQPGKIALTWTSSFAQAHNLLTQLDSDLDSKPGRAAMRPASIFSTKS
jgi:hypothetical protein